MKFPKPKTFWGAISPTTVTRWAFGIGIFEYPAGRPRRVLSLCWMVAWLIVVLIFVEKAIPDSIWDTQESSVIMTGYFMTLSIFLIGGAAAICQGHARSKKFKDCLFKLDRVNEMLHKLEILDEYEFVFKSQVIHLIGIFLFVMLGVVIVHYLWSLVTISSAAQLGYVISMTYQLLTSLLDDYTFCSCIRYIGKRFQHLNELLIKSGIEVENAWSTLQDTRRHIPWLLPPVLGIHPQSRYVSIADDQWIMARKIHHDLCSIALDLNEVFGIQILLSVATSFVMITIGLFDFYFCLSMPAQSTVYGTIGILLIFVPLNCLLMLKVFSIIYTCLKTSTEAQLTGELIYELITPATCSEIREEIYAFALQLIGNPLRFTASGFFTLDFTMINGMIGTVITYLIVMVQASDHTT